MRLSLTWSQLLAADPAVGTGRPDLFHLRNRPGAQGLFLDQGPDRAGLDALAAEGAAVVIDQREPALGVILPAAVGNGDGLVDLDLLAGLDAPAALDAPGEVPVDQGVVVVHREGSLGRGPVLDRDAVLNHQVLELGNPRKRGRCPRDPGADMDSSWNSVHSSGSRSATKQLWLPRGDQHLQDGPPGLDHPAAVGLDPEPGLGRGFAGRNQVVPALDLDHAQPAGPVGAGLLQVAQGGDLDPAVPGRLENRLARAEVTIRLRL